VAAAGVMNSLGASLPAEVAGVTSLLAAVHRPLVLTALGLMVPLTLTRNHLRMLLALLGT